MKSPCKGCEKRHLGCHSECLDYIQYSIHRKRICRFKRMEDTTWTNKDAWVLSHNSMEKHRHKNYGE